MKLCLILIVIFLLNMFLLLKTCLRYLDLITKNITECSGKNVDDYKRLHFKYFMSKGEQRRYKRALKKAKEEDVNL